MTPEEAIRILGQMLDEFCNEDAWVQECKDAVDMAIEALKEQPKHEQNTMSKQPDLETLGAKTGETCADAISRRAAIDALSYCQTYLFDSRDHDKKISLEDAEYALEQLQPAQPEQQSCKYAERKSGTEQMIMMRYLRKE